jgi:hypothetical protein
MRPASILLTRKSIIFIDLPDVSKPSQPSLTKRCGHVARVGSFRHLVVGNLVLLCAWEITQQPTDN